MKLGQNRETPQNAALPYAFKTMPAHEPQILQAQRETVSKTAAHDWKTCDLPPPESASQGNPDNGWLPLGFAVKTTK